MNNNDLKKITEIKQYLLDPPATFRLSQYALAYLQDAVTVLTAYPKANNVMDEFKNLIGQLENKEITQYELRSTLKEAGTRIGHLTSS